MSDLDVHDLLDDVSLLAISTITLSARRIRRDLADSDLDDLSVDPQYTLQTDSREDQKGFRVILQTKVDAPIGEIRCDIQAEYELQELSMESVPHEVFQEFVNNVAIMGILPFVRQGIADITLRVFESPLLMPLIERGQITFKLPPVATGSEVED